MPDTFIRQGDWTQTYSGRQFWPLDPRPEDVALIDIAAALSKIARYGGHCLRFQSVAEHCVLMVRRMDGVRTPRERRTVLLHDASEAYLLDMPRPLKPYLPGYLAFEDQLMRVIAQRFDFDWPLPAWVKALDTGILRDETAQNMAPPPVPWRQFAEPALGVTLQFWSPDQAFAEFMSAAQDCGVRV